MTKTHSLMATTREWTDEAGKKHKVRIEAGAIFRSKAGALVVKMDALPVTSSWSGWLAAEPCAPAMPPGRRLPPGMPPAPPPPTDGEPNPDEDVPF